MLRPVSYVPERLRSAIIVHLGILLPSAFRLGWAGTRDVQTLEPLHWILDSRIPTALNLFCGHPVFLTDRVLCEPALLIKWR